MRRITGNRPGFNLKLPIQKIEAKTEAREEELGKLLGDVPAASAILDRFLHRAQTNAIWSAF